VGSANIVVAPGEPPFCFASYKAYEDAVANKSISPGIVVDVRSKPRGRSVVEDVTERPFIIVGNDRHLADANIKLKRDHGMPCLVMCRQFIASSRYDPILAVPLKSARRTAPSSFVSKCEQEGHLRDVRRGPHREDPQVRIVREGRLELPRPLGHRILRLLALRTDPGSTCRPVPSGVVLCPSVSSCREQTVSKAGLRVAG
jgi:hypothetical protein